MQEHKTKHVIEYVTKSIKRLFAAGFGILLGSSAGVGVTIKFAKSPLQLQLCLGLTTAAIVVTVLLIAVIIILIIQTTVRLYRGNGWKEIIYNGKKLKNCCLKQGLEFDEEKTYKVTIWRCIGIKDLIEELEEV